MEVPRLGVESELQLLAYTRATKTQDPSLVCDLHHSSWQCGILNPLSRARNWTCILMDTSQVCYHWATMGTPNFILFLSLPGSRTTSIKLPLLYVKNVQIWIISRRDLCLPPAPDTLKVQALIDNGAGIFPVMYIYKESDFQSRSCHGSEAYGRESSVV